MTAKCGDPNEIRTRVTGVRGLFPQRQHTAFCFVSREIVHVAGWNAVGCDRFDAQRRAQSIGHESITRERCHELIRVGQGAKTRRGIVAPWCSNRPGNVAVPRWRRNPDTRRREFRRRLLAVNRIYRPLTRSTALCWGQA